MPSFIDTATLKPGTRLCIMGLDCPEEVLEIGFIDPRAGNAMFSHSGAFEGVKEGKFVAAVLQAEILDENEPPPDSLRLDGKIVVEAELTYPALDHEHRDRRAEPRAGPGLGLWPRRGLLDVGGSVGRAGFFRTAWEASHAPRR